MKLNSKDKRQNALDLLSMLNKSEIVSDLDRVKDMLEEFAVHQQIFMKDYYAIRKKVYDHSCNFVEKGFI
jgi:hypothetical protein